MTRESLPRPEYGSDGTDSEASVPEDFAAVTVGTTAARHTLDAQLDTLADVDTRALQVLQVAVALLALGVPGLSLIGSGLASAITPAVAVGVVLLVAGAVLAGATYVVTPRFVGVDPDGLRGYVARATNRQFQYALLGGYAVWIRFNDYAVRRGALLVTTSVLLVVGGALALGIGVLRLLVGPLPATAPLGALAVFAAGAYATGIHRQIRRFWTIDRPNGE